MVSGSWLGLTLRVDHLSDCDDILMVQRAQILDFPQGGQREPLIIHILHDHVELLECEPLDLPSIWVLVLGPVHLAEGALSDLFDLLEVTQPVSAD